MRGDWKRRLKRGGLIAGGTLAAFIICAVLYFVSPLGRNLVVSLLMGAAAGDGAATFESVSGSWPGSLIIKGVTVADKQGPWLKLAQLRLAWRPLALFSGTLAVTELELDTPVMLREPAPDTSPSSSGGGVSKPPVAISLETLTIKNGAIERPVSLGFDGKGSALWTSDVTALKVEFNRRGGADEHLRADVRIDQHSRAIHLNLDAQSVEGGLFAALFNDPSFPAVALTASGTGPAENWHFDAKSTVGQYGAVALGGTLSWTDVIALEISGDVKPGSAVGSSLRALIGPSAAIKAHLRHENGADEIQAHVAADNAEVTANTTLGAQPLIGSRTLGGTVHIKTRRDAAFGSRIDASVADIEAALSGNLDAPNAALTFALKSARYGSYQLDELAGTAKIDSASANQRVVEGQGNIGLLRARGQTVIEKADWSLAGTQDRDKIRDVKIALNSAALMLDAKGGLDLKEGGADLKAHLVSHDLHAITPIAHVRLGGQADLDLALSRSKTDAEGVATLKGTISNGSVAGQDFSSFAGQTLSIDAALTQHKDGTVTLDNGSLSGDRLKAQLKGRVGPTLDVPVALSTDLSALGTFAGIDMSGPADGRLLALGTLDDPKLALDLTSKKAVVEGRDVGVMTVAFMPSGSLPSGRARLQAKGVLGSMDVTIPVALDSKGLLMIGPLDGAAYGTRLAGTLKESGDAFIGQVSARIGDLSGLYSLAQNEPVRMTGEGTATLDLGAGGVMNANIDLRNVSREDRQLALAKLTVKGGLSKSRANVALKATDVRVPGFNQTIDARQISLQGDGPLSNLRWSFTANDLTGAQGVLNAQGGYAQTGKDQTLSFDKLTGTLWQTPIALDQPSRLSLRKGETQLSPFALRIGSGRLQLAYLAQASGQKGDLALSAFPISFLGRIIGADWPEGRLAGQAGFDSRTAKPTGFADIRVSDAVFSAVGQKTAEPLAGQFKANWAGSTLTVDGHADRLNTYQGTGAAPMSLQARLPLIRKSDGGMVLDPKGPVSGEVHWSGELRTLWAILPFDAHRVSGDAQMNIRASGRWGAPKLEGTLNVANGRYESLLTGTRLNNIVLSLNAGSSGGQAHIQGDDGRGGRFTGDGKVRFGENSSVQTDLTLTNLRIVGLDRLTAEASGPLSLTGSLSEPKLGGKLRIDHVDASIPDRLPPSIARLNVTYVDTIESTEPQFEAPDTEKDKNAALSFSIDVDVPAQAFLRGRGLTSEWRGKIAVRGTSLTPRLKGELELVHGDLSFGGHTYPLSRGRVTFAGGRKVDPMLDIASTRNAGGSDITLTVSGLSSAPRFDLSSSPDMPRDQAMSLFLFGKSAQSLTTLELLDVARSVASLTGATGGGFDPIDKTRRALGLDVLTVGVGDNTASGTAGNVASSAQLQAGRYVSDRVYLGVKQGAQTGSSAVQLNYSITPHISAGTEVGANSSGKASIDWKWDY